MSGTERAWLLGALIALVALLARRAASTRADHAGRWGWSVAATGVAAMLLTTWIWHGLRSPAVINDEAAYLLQAELFARGAWSAASPGPIDAFVQPAVLITPVLAPKMPPGHALLMVPGVWMNLPGLVPVLLTGATAALLMLLAREVAGSGAGMLSVALWLSQAGQMRWRASYFSEMTTGCLWLLGWWALLRWRRSAHFGWLGVLALAAGLGAITRPLTMLAWVLPVAVIVLYDIYRTGRWAQLLGGIVIGSTMLSVMPIQNYAVLGDWRASPLALYTRQYMPFDVVGFGAHSAEPELRLPAKVQEEVRIFESRHASHIVARLPAIFAERARAGWHQVAFGWRIALVPALLWGIVFAGALLRFALGTVALTYAAYLVYAHEPAWTVYYLETTPVLAVTVAAGLIALLTRAIGKPVTANVGVACAACVMLIAAPDFVGTRANVALSQAPLSTFTRAATSAAGARGALVFVPDDSNGPPSLNLVRNVAAPDPSAIITAYLRDDCTTATITARYAGRTVLQWDEITARMRHITPPSLATCPSASLQR